MSSRKKTLGIGGSADTYMGESHIPWGDLDS